MSNVEALKSSFAPRSPPVERCEGFIGSMPNILLKYCGLTLVPAPSREGCRKCSLLTAYVKKRIANEKCGVVVWRAA